MKLIRLLSVALLLIFSCAEIVWAGHVLDVENSKDYGLFSRMPGFYINDYEANFNALDVPTGPETQMAIEGDYTFLDYILEDGGKSPSKLQIVRNFSNLIKELGGVTVYEGESENHYFAVTYKLEKSGKQIWVVLSPGNEGDAYSLKIVEKGDMIQDVTASDMLDALARDGRVTLYIHFNSGKSDLLPESRPVIDEIVALLKNNPELKLSIEGHTDNVGEPTMNKQLSEQRALAVLSEIKVAGVAVDGFIARGFGQEKPIADNKSEEGRAKNRRVELVKQ